ncbi:MAG: hypothetical protein E7440_07615 [Ruminococcaceae bacterium]|nr:hypothetical protein [Oscillospiraceae bacterium]
MKKTKPLWLKILLWLVLLGVLACAWEFASSQNPYILPVKRTLKYDVLGMTTANESRETAGLNADTLRVSVYENGERADGHPSPDTDCKRVYDDGSVTRLVNYTGGYQLDLPANAIFDFSLSPLFTSGYGEGFDVTVSREKADYQSLKDVITFELSTFLPWFFEDYTVENYVYHYEYRFLLDEGWQQNNGVTTTSWTDDLINAYFVEAQVDGLSDDLFDGYLYVNYFTPSREYLRVMFRYQKEDSAMRDKLLELAKNTRIFDPMGTAVYRTNYELELPSANWSMETAKTYVSFANDNDSLPPLQWGIFLQDFYVNGFDGELAKLEEKLDYTFPVVLYYRHFPTHEFPTEVMQENYEAGRLVELTLQLTDNNNIDMFAKSPLLEIYRGNMDDELRAWARAAADFGHPFLFRLNNEMNSDWTSYGGVVNMADPAIFTAVWQRIFHIFQEEGVDNCIWIFNPHDRQAPPSNWNNSLAYYPGNEYVQMIGVTGYNNGTYYTQWAEEWREFKDIYDQIWEEYHPHFGDFPWIITEFASSGIGGDKVAWMEDMFEHIDDYPNIRIAVWFSFADFDDANGGTPARTYWLDETPETLDAFRQGLKKQFGN